MSWQAYVDSNLVGTGNVTSAAILQPGEGAIWAKSANLNLSAAEAKAIASAPNNDAVQGAGLVIGGVKYQIITYEKGQRVYAKKQGPGGLTIVQTGQTVIVGFYTDQQPGNANTTVEKVADYLKNAGY